MYTVTKELYISAAHQLRLSYKSKCTRKHGHNWKIRMTFRSDKLNEDGMVIDFAHVKKAIQDKFDHRDLNKVLPQMNPTAENLAHHLVHMFPEAVRAEVTESPNNTAVYELDCQ